MRACPVPCGGIVWRSSPPSHSRLLARRPANLQKLAAVAFGNYIYTSDDSGVTWTARMTDATRNWWSIASSEDGTVRQAKMRACVERWWVRVAFVVASHSEGRLARRPTPYNLQTLAAVVVGGYIYTSTDSGVAWTVRADDTTRQWRSIASSSDGTVRRPKTRACRVGRWWVGVAFVASFSRLLCTMTHPTQHTEICRRG